MELDNIEKLLEKYFEATTTVAEEETLRAYFSNENVASHLEQYAPMFTYFSKAKDEKFTKQVTLKPRRNYYRWMSVAAVAVLMFGVYFGKSIKDKNDTKFAYQETKRAIELLGENFNKGAEKMAYLTEFETTKQKIYNNN